MRWAILESEDSGNRKGEGSFFIGEDGCEDLGVVRWLRARTTLELTGGGRAEANNRGSFTGVVSGVASTAASGGEVPIWCGNEALNT